MHHLLLIPIVFFILVIYECIVLKTVIGFIFWLVATIAVAMWYRRLLISKKEIK